MTEEKAKVKSGIAFHVHHDVLCEYGTDYDERVKYIKSNKPKAELELRLTLFKLIPEERLPGAGSPERAKYKAARAECDAACAEYNAAWAKYKAAWAECDAAYAEYDTAYAEYDTACAEYDTAWAECKAARAKCDAAWAECKAARAECDAARAECDAACAEYKDKFDAEFRILHSVLCPNCPWDGTTIFSEKAR